MSGASQWKILLVILMVIFFQCRSANAQAQSPANRPLINFGIVGADDQTSGWLFNQIYKAVTGKTDNPTYESQQNGPKVYSFSTKSTEYSALLYALKTSSPESSLATLGQIGSLIIVSRSSKPDLLLDWCTWAHVAGVSQVLVFVVDEGKSSQLPESEIKKDIVGCGFLSDHIQVMSIAKDKDGRAILKTIDSFFKPIIINKDQPFLMAVDDTFVLHEKGMIVTGNIKTGRVRPNDHLKIINNGQSRDVIAKQVEFFRGPLDEAVAGDNVGIHIGMFSHSEISAGALLTSDTSVSQSTNLKAVLTIPPKIGQNPIAGREYSFYMFTAVDKVVVTSIEPIDSDHFFVEFRGVVNSLPHKKDWLIGIGEGKQIIAFGKLSE